MHATNLTSSQALLYRDIEVMLFNTCNYNCAYCSFVTGGTVGYVADLEPFKDKAYIDAVVRFFTKYSSSKEKWSILFSGGEPLLTPNLDYLSSELIRHGNRLRYNTNLAVPIDKDQAWLAANPPEAVDVLMVSLHPESLEKYDTILERMRKLKALGYRIIPRMVAHPQLFDWFDRVDADMASMGLSFTPIPMFSTHYPEAYAPAERSKIEKHVKAFGGLIQLNGGLDAKGHLCHAGSRLFALGLGRTGKGDLYRCVSCSPNGYLGNIFRDEEIKFLKAPAPCCQRSQHCTCSFHFESNAVVGAEDGENYEKLKNGKGERVAVSFDAFVARNKLKFKFHKSAPQGTDIGEKLLIYSPQAALDAVLPAPRSEVFSLERENARLAIPFKKDVTVADSANGVSVTAVAPGGGGIQFQVPVTPGKRSCLTFEGRVSRGNAVIAVYSGSEAHFWHQIPRFRGQGVLTQTFQPKVDRLTVYVYADEPVVFEFSKVAVLQSSGSEDRESAATNEKAVVAR